MDASSDSPRHQRKRMPDHLYPPLCDTGPMWINRVVLLFWAAMLLMAWSLEDMPWPVVLFVLAGLAFEIWAQLTRARCRRIWHRGQRVTAEVRERRERRPLNGGLVYIAPALGAAFEMLGPERLTLRYRVGDRQYQQTQRVNTIVYHRVQPGATLTIAVDPKRPQRWVPII